MPADNANTLLAKIDSIDWSAFDGPPLYSAESVRQALQSLVTLNGTEPAHAVADSLLNALGNNHGGVYYPAVLSAIDLIIEVAEDPENEPRQICARATLNNLLYFQPQTGTYTGVSEEGLKTFVQTKLAPYSDDNWDGHKLS